MDHEIPPGYRQHTFATFEPRTPTLRDALSAALAYCQAFPHRHSDRGLGLLIWGASGTGKTHLAVAVMQELVANHKMTAAFWDFSALLKEISRSYDKTTYMAELSVLESVMRVDLLVLDDLASQRMHDWMRNTLFEILDSRYRNMLPTLITTPFEEGDPRASAHASYKRQEFLAERIGANLQSRILEMCSVIPTQNLQERATRRSPERPRHLRGLRKATEGS